MQTIGERLEEARKRKGVSIREAAEATKIRGDYLHKFESNQFDLKLPEIYVRGFLRTYAVFLKLPGDKIVNDYKGLGLGDPKPRGINRESFGRMDLSVTSAKSANRDTLPATPETAPETGSPAAAPENNPATFRPRAGAGPQIDQGLIIKGLVLLTGVTVLVLLIVVVVRLFSGNSTTAARGDDRTAASGQIWVQPARGEVSITAVAVEEVQIRVTQTFDQQVILQGKLAKGERRTIPRRGKLNITAEPYTAVVFEINGKQHPMPAPSSDLPPP